MKQTQSEIDEEEAAFRNEMMANAGIASSTKAVTANNLKIETVYDPRDPYFRCEPKNKSTRFNLQGAINDSLDQCRKEYEKGDKSAAMRAIYTSLKYEKLPPAWARNYLIDAYEAGISTFEAETWDDVLGRPYPKNLRLHAAIQKQELMHSVWLSVRLEYQNGTEINSRKGGKKRVSINEAFRRVGKKFHIERTTVCTYYYEYEKFLSDTW